MTRRKNAWRATNFQLKNTVSGDGSPCYKDMRFIVPLTHDGFIRVTPIKANISIYSDLYHINHKSNTLTVAFKYQN